MDKVDFIIALESGEISDEELVKGMQEMIDDGTAYQLQGFYGRLAEQLIEAGLCRRRSSDSPRNSPEAG